MSNGLRCWIGCIAYIVKDDFSENAGQLVTVIAKALPDDAYYYGPGASYRVDWEVVSSAPLVAWTCDGAKGVFPPGEPIAFADGQLRPITPPPGATDTPTEVLKPEPIGA